MSLDRFRNKNGDHSRYALACGYIQRREDIEGNHVDLFMEHDHYHVRGYRADHSRFVWETFDKGELCKARTEYRKQVRVLKAMTS